MCRRNSMSTAFLGKLALHEKSASPGRLHAGLGFSSYSGAVPNEKITWGKLDINTPKYIVESDATIVAPLIFAYILGW